MAAPELRLSMTGKPDASVNQEEAPGGDFFQQFRQRYLSLELPRGAGA